MLRHLILFCVALSLTIQMAIADIVTARRHFSNASLVGEGRLRVMLWDVFDAHLYAPDGQYKENAPFALSLSYLRHLKGSKIVDNTIKELKAQGLRDQRVIATWRSELKQIIPDVDKQTTITGVRDEFGNTLFYRNGVSIGRIDDPTFTSRFFNIWLGELTTRPKLRKQLLDGSSA